jgi:hypothetical protein
LAPQQTLPVERWNGEPAQLGGELTISGCVWMTL